MSDTKYAVPLVAKNVPDWSRAVPTSHPGPEPRPGDVGVWITAEVPADVRAKWESSEGDVSDTPPTEGG
jgi:hypothetical protein